MRLRTHVALAVLLASPLVARAQGEEPPPSAAELPALLARMRSFADSMAEYGPSESFAAWFPRQGSWTWTQRLRDAPGGPGVSIRRFPAERTVEALSDSGPLCPSFFRGGGEVATGELSIAGWLSREKPGWRRVGRRFVARGGPFTSATYVEWRREAGEWVISAFGDEEVYVPPSPMPSRPRVRLSPTPGPTLALPLPADGRYAAGAPWFESSGFIEARGTARVKYGLPRRLEAGDVTRIGWIEGVPVFTEPIDAETVSVLYVAVDRTGMFQPYYPVSNYRCR